MSVKYHVREHINPSNPQAPKKYYPSIKASGRCDQRRLAELIAAMSTISTADTMGMLEAMLVIIPDQLAKGNIVELGEFGSFWLKVNADGAETEEDVRATQIRRLMPHFKPGKEFKKALKAVEFKRS
jgi:predicted histone-like DNA-binding protein